MAQQKSRYIETRNAFLALFLVGACLTSVVYTTILPRIGSPSPGASPDYGAQLTTASLVAGLLSSIVGFAGFVSTAILAWRKEAREKEDRELDRKLKEIEIEKVKLELEKLRAEQEKRSQEENKVT